MQQSASVGSAAAMQALPRSFSRAAGACNTGSPSPLIAARCTPRAPAFSAACPGAQHAPSRSTSLCRASAAPSADAAPAAAAPAPAESLLPEQLVWPGRSHEAGTLRLGDEGSKVVLCGWVDRNRNMGGVQFFDIRDHSGLMQVRWACWAWAGCS